MSVQAQQDRERPTSGHCASTNHQCSHCVPQKTLTANRNKEMPRHESGGNPHPKSGHLQPLAASGRAERKGRMCRTRLRCCLCVWTHTQSTRGFSSRDGMRAAGTGWRMQARAPRRPRIGKPGRAGDAPSLPLSAASRRPGGINTHFLPLISSRGAGGWGLDRGGEKKKNNSGKKNSFPATEEKDKVWIH